MAGIIDKFRLDGKKALVTGAGRGIGRSFATALAEAGADVAVVDILGEDAMRTAGEIAAATGRRVFGIHADIAQIEDVRRMVAETVDAFGRLDIAVNNAGISIPIKPALDVTDEEWRRQLDVNLNGTWNCVREEARVMIPNRYGKIINTGSICGHIIWPTPQLPYSVSKAAVLHLTRAAAAEFIRYGIRVNSISPGVTKVEDLFPEVIDTFFKTAPIDRYGLPEDHQGALIFLAGPLSDFMIGQDLVLDGGYTIM
ncbi:MAG: SDR family oxidoreductase [Kiritimatiellae bacterium]|nr:SDR family oxidoreductase [Kiritimatiellia bacterium]MDD3546232.1 SDR family oxidoreductase [Kiritimatiellia bacterium]MDD4623662.1 SDR family oxidoreductase [Kiritimatiellia bacterium]